MIVAFTSYAFDKNIENSGNRIKLGLFQCKAACVAKMMVHKLRQIKKGNLVCNRDIIHQKGDVYLLDCNVTGSDEGTLDKPNFSLMSLF